MATLINQGTLRFTPTYGTQQSLVSNTTVTEVSISYALELTHAASPTTFSVGDTIVYTVLMRNTGTGTLYNPFVNIDVTGGELSLVPESAVAFLYANGSADAVPVTATQASPITLVLDTVIPAGGFVYLTYSAVVTSAEGAEIVSVATGGANEGSPTGPTISDSDSAIITRVLLSVVKNAPDTAEVGDSISYQFVIENTSGAPVTLDSLTDELPEGFSFTTATLSVNGVEFPLVAGTDYSISAEGVFVLDPAAPVTLPAGGVAVLTLNGVVTA